MHLQIPSDLVPQYRKSCTEASVDMRLNLFRGRFWVIFPQRRVHVTSTDAIQYNNTGAERHVRESPQSQAKRAVL